MLALQCVCTHRKKTCLPITVYLCLYHKLFRFDVGWCKVKYVKCKLKNRIYNDQPSFREMWSKCILILPLFTKRLGYFTYSPYRNPVINNIHDLPTFVGSCTINRQYRCWTSPFNRLPCPALLITQGISTTPYCQTNWKQYRSKYQN